MTPLRLLVDAERLVAGHLRSVPEVVALVGARVYTAIPPEPVFPLVRLTRIGGTPAVPAHLDRARLQIEAWGTSKAQARDLAETVHAALYDMPGQYPAGMVTAVEDDLGLTWQPDPDTDRDRYLFGVTVYTHPLPE